MQNTEGSGQSEADVISSSEKKVLLIGKRAAVALDKVLSSEPVEDKKWIRRWGEVGGFCAVLTGVKPALDSLENWTFGKPLLEKMTEIDPSLRFAFDWMPNGAIVNREAILQTMRQNQDYFPEVVNYDQAKEYFKQHYRLNLNPEGMEPQDFINRVVRTGLFLGYPKLDSEKMAQHILGGFDQLRELIEFGESKDVIEKLEISPADLDILRQFYDVSTMYSTGLISQNLRKADELEDQVKSILDRSKRIDPEVKRLLLARRAHMHNQVGWIGYNDSSAGVEAMQKIDAQFEKTGMKSVLIKHDVVLQGHNIYNYTPSKAA